MLVTVFSIFIDVVLVALFSFFLILFFKYGFAKTVYKIGKTWLSAFCSMILGPWVATQLQNLFLRNAITGGIHKTLKNLVENNANEYNLSQLFENLPEGFVKFLGHYDINLAALEAEYGPSTQASNEIIEAISHRIATPCIEMVSSIIGHIICFIVPLVFFVWLNRQIKRRRIAFFRILDHITGFLVGAIVGYCAVLGLSVLLHTIFQVIVAFDATSGVTAVYKNSYIFEFLSEFDTLGAIKSVVQMLA